MSATRQLTITLPNDIAEAVKSKVASGESVSEGDVLSVGFRRTRIKNHRFSQAGYDQFRSA